MVNSTEKSCEYSKNTDWNLTRDMWKFRQDVESIREEVFDRKYEKSTSGHQQVSKSAKQVTRREFLNSLVANHSRNNSKSHKTQTHKRNLSIPVSKVEVDLLAKLLKVDPVRLSPSAKKNSSSAGMEKSLEHSTGNFPPENRRNSLRKSTLPLGNESANKTLSSEIHKSQFGGCENPRRSLTPKNKENPKRSPKKAMTLTAIFESFFSSDNNTTPSKQEKEKSLNSPKNHKGAELPTVMEEPIKKNNWFSKMFTTPKSPYSRMQESASFAETKNDSAAYTFPTSEDPHKPTANLTKSSPKKGSSPKKKNEPRPKFKTAKSSFVETRTVPHLRRPEISAFSESKNTYWKQLRSKNNFLSKTVWQ